MTPFSPVRFGSVFTNIVGMETIDSAELAKRTRGPVEIRYHRDQGQHGVTYANISNDLKGGLMGDRMFLSALAAQGGMCDIRGPITNSHYPDDQALLRQVQRGSKS
ncbi:MAG: hypothetical protein IPK79_08215 [Vampirovibrionales bacterium]|nr:hypothetical protein [Vampirovibrionales bacterium]